MEIILMIEGQAEFHIGGQTYEAMSGDMYFISEGKIHSGYWSGDTPNYYSILFERPALSNNLSNHQSRAPLIGGGLAPPDRLLPDELHYNELSEMMLDMIDEFAQKKQGYEMVIQSLLHVLLIRLTRAYATASDEPFLSSHAEQLKHVMVYVSQHYSDKISLEEVAKLANMSIYHFCRTFKKAVGLTFMEFLNSYRINRAAELIIQTDLPITRIAEQVGFGTINYFDEMFKKCWGQSPTRFRKNNKKQKS
ncbi:helix-turn-helix transcriptional regulator [Paenibacillus sp. PAMC21692]|nr:helix-turn-helix transcriptional regulator [Paenibacillus sp. PAMC21692]